MNLMIVKQGEKSITITTICEPTHIPRVGESILFKHKEYTVLQIIWDYNEKYVFAYCKEEE